MQQCQRWTRARESLEADGPSRRLLLTWTERMDVQKPQGSRRRRRADTLEGRAALLNDGL